MRSARQVLLAGILAIACALTVGSAASGAIDVATFHGLPPARLMDSRAGYSTIDGVAQGGGAVAPGSTTDLQVSGRGGVPGTGAGAVALNVTATNPSAPGFLTVWPTGAARPTSSNVNFVAGQTIPNMVVVPLGTDGHLSIFNYAGTTDVVVDVLGWFPTGTAFNGLNPARLMDSRAGYSTIDGVAQGGGAVAPGSTTDLQVSGRGGVPGTGAGAVALNVTATNPSAPGFLTVWPTGAARPTSSNVNFVAGQTIPNMVVVPLGTDGHLSIFNYAGTTDVVVDVLGWFPTGNGFSGLTPGRVLDTRPSYPTVDGLFSGQGALTGPGVLNLTVVGRGGVPASGAGSVALNVTVTGPTTPSFVTLYPHGTVRPTASNLNFVADQTIANMVIVPIGSNGQISIFNYGGQVDVVVDVLGWFPNPTNPPTTYGSTLVLKANGVGDMFFSATPAAAISYFTANFGTVMSDDTQTFEEPAGSSWWDSTRGQSFAFRYSRVTCFSGDQDYDLCILFGGNTLSSLTFVGYLYTGSSLVDTRGLGPGARGSDFPGTISSIGFGCSYNGFGEAASGIHLELVSIGRPFNDPNTGTVNQLTQSEVVVSVMLGGTSFPEFPYECYPDVY